MSEQTTPSIKLPLYIIIAVLAVVSIAYRLVHHTHLEQSSLLFIGLPTLISLLAVKFGERPKTAFGVVFTIITIFLLISAMLFGEGLICILMAAPLFYGVGAVLTAIFVFITKSKGSTIEAEDNTLQISLLLPIALLLAQPTDYGREAVLESISTTHTIRRSDTQNLNKLPELDNDLALFFQLGFPKPIAIAGEGLEVGDTRTIQFESSTKGIGELVLEVEKVDDSSLVFGVKSDESHIAHWMSWKKIEIDIRPIDELTSQVVWTSHYRCELGPSWYFRPLERYAVRQSNAHLISTFFEVID